MNWLNLIVFAFGYLCIFVSANDEDKAKKLLSDLGYYNKHSFSKNEMYNALKSYQNFFGLSETGALDEQTKANMQKPRCGVPDQNGYFATTPIKWTKNSLTYRFLNYGRDMNKSDVVSTIRKAFDMWMAVADLKVEETKSRKSDMTIKFTWGDHGLSDYPHNVPFDGRGGTIAHAFFPPVGKIHFDEDETFSLDGKKGTYDLLWVAVHEFGHALGLKHSNVRGTIMWPQYVGYMPDMKLAKDDIEGIQNLFGKGPYVQRTTPAPPPCVDDHPSCPAWATVYCTNEYVIKNCRLSCDINGCASANTTPQPLTSKPKKPCVDTRSACPYWKGLGDCQRNSNVRAACRKSCNTDGCNNSANTTPQTKACIDTRYECPGWKNKGLCPHNSNMRDACRKSCNTDGCNN